MLVTLKEILAIAEERHIAVGSFNTPNLASLRAIIAAAGMAAHLAGAIAANTTLPVIGIPVASAGLGGLDALLSTVQMPTGIPVATVAVNGAANAALLCIQMLAIEDAALAAALDAKRARDRATVLEKDAGVMDKLAAL